MKTVELVIDGDSFDVLLDGAFLAGGDDIAFKDASADGLAKLEFSTSTKWTGGWFDNMSATAAEPAPDTEIPEPATMALPSLAACGLGGYVRRRRGA